MKSELKLVNEGLSRTLDLIIFSGARQATAYLSEKEVIRATRPLYNGKIDRRNKTITVVLTLGRPNYRERLFIKACKKAGEPFPVRKVQIKWPKK
jgi:hypothetical protein